MVTEQDGYSYMLGIESDDGVGAKIDGPSAT